MAFLDNFKSYMGGDWKQYFNKDAVKDALGIAKKEVKSLDAMKSENSEYQTMLQEKSIIEEKQKDSKKELTEDEKANLGKQITDYDTKLKKLGGDIETEYENIKKVAEEMLKKNAAYLGALELGNKAKSNVSSMKKEIDNLKSEQKNLEKINNQLKKANSKVRNTNDKLNNLKDVRSKFQTMENSEITPRDKENNQKDIESTEIELKEAKELANKINFDAICMFSVLELKNNLGKAQLITENIKKTIENVSDVRKSFPKEYDPYIEYIDAEIIYQKAKNTYQKTLKEKGIEKFKEESNKYFERFENAFKEVKNNPNKFSKKEISICKNYFKAKD